MSNESNKSLVLIVNEAFQDTKYSRLSVLREIKKGSSRYYQCRCDCGTLKDIYKFDVISGKTRSCGCLSRETTSERNLRHGLIEKFPREYWIWKAINQRCHNPRNIAYKNYGARGIFLCQEWRDSFETFMNDMGERKSRSYTIERLNNDGPYSKENCIWADRFQQAANRRNTKRFSFAGAILTVREISNLTGVKVSTLRDRMRLGGMTITEATTWSRCGK